MLCRPLATLLAALMLPPLPGDTPSIAQGDDCREADRFERLSDGSMAIDAASMHAVIPRVLQQPSRDNDIQVCAYQMPIYLEPFYHGG
jgi:hypothetical protein